MKSARGQSVRVLLDRFEHSVPFDLSFQRDAFISLSDRDQALAREIVLGVCRRMNTLDFYLSRLARIPPGRMDREVLWILRAGLYQLKFLRVPDHAAVNESVRLCRVFRKSSASGMVNAVLRSFLRREPEIPAGDSPEALALQFGHPGWLVERYLSEHGLQETRRVLRMNNEVPEPVVCVNRLRIDPEQFAARLGAEGIECEPVSELPGAFVVRAPQFVKHAFYRRGYCFFMDASSQRIGNLPELSGRRFLGDFCAAPGGKSLLIASRMDDRARLVCSDRNWKRLREMQHRFRRGGLRGADLICADLGRPAPWLSRFDFVLADVPCSGLGTIRSNPDIRWSVREQDLKNLQARQVRIIRNAFRSLVPGGELLYSTCSTEVEENEQVVERLLGCEPSAGLSGGFLRIPMGRDAGGGFFAARIRRS